MNATEHIRAANDTELAVALRRLEAVVDLLSGVSLAQPDARRLSQAHAFAVAARRNLRAALAHTTQEAR